MRAQLSNRDYEHLSAYLDGQLAPGEKRKLEERLQTRPDLQQALEELTRTRSLLRSAPRRRAPRNFTLTPAMVGQGRQARGSWFAGLFPTLSFASAVATLALVLSLVFELLPGSQSMMTAQAPVQDTAAMEQPVAIEQPAAMEQPAAAPEAGRAMDSAMEEAAPAAEPEMGVLAEPGMDTGEAGAAKAAPEAPPVIGMMDPSPGRGGGGGGGGYGGYAPAPQMFGMGGDGNFYADQKGWAPNWVLPLESVGSLDPEGFLRAAPRERLAEPPSEITGTGPILGVPAPEDAGQIQSQSSWGEPLVILSGPAAGGMVGPSASAAGPRILGLSGLRFTQALLALLAVGLGLAALLAYRRMTGA